MNNAAHLEIQDRVRLTIDTRKNKHKEYSKK
jgi:hypothetical protein